MAENRVDHDPVRMSQLTEFQPFGEGDTAAQPLVGCFAGLNHQNSAISKIFSTLFSGIFYSNTEPGFGAPSRKREGRKGPASKVEADPSERISLSS